MYFKKNLTLTDFQAMEAIERQYYPPDFIASAENSYSWYLHWPNSVLAAFENDKLIGFMNLFPIHDKLYSQISEGTFNDSGLTKYDIHIPVQSDTTYKLFLSCVAIDKKHLNKGIASKLLNAYLELYQEYEQAGCIFGKIVTDNVTEAGLKFSKAIGLTPIRQSDHDSWICSGTYEFLKRRIIYSRKRLLEDEQGKFEL